MIDLHVVTVTRLCLLFGEAIKRRGSGYILNVSSMAARLPVPGITVYSATKAYLRSFGKSLSYELRPYGVTLTTVCPAAIATPLYRLSEDKMQLGIRTGLIHTPRWLVKKALRALFRGRRVVSPSVMNGWLPALLALMPSPIIAALWKRFK
jgi:short-subunit dehydrogenase